MKYKNIDTIYMVMAIKRTGHHGIIDWLRFSYKPNTVFYNDCIFGESPHDSAYNYWIDYNYFMKPSKDVKLDVNKNINCLVCNYEDFDLENFSVDKAMKIVNSITENYKRLFFITVNRDPFNHQSSIYTFTNGERETDVKEWKKYAKEHLGITNYVPNAIHIDYSLWMENKEEKEKLYKEIGGTAPYKDIYPRISPHGCGSSFNPKQYNARIITMGALERWKEVDYKLIKSLLEDEELVDLARKLYGDKFIDKIIGENK